MALDLKEKYKYSGLSNILYWDRSQGRDEEEQKGGSRSACLPEPNSWPDLTSSPWMWTLDIAGLARLLLWTQSTDSCGKTALLCWEPWGCYLCCFQRPMQLPLPACLFPGSSLSNTSIKNINCWMNKHRQQERAWRAKFCFQLLWVFKHFPKI